jgi:hypothetical protein
VFLWFIGASVLAVWWVFRDPMFDYRPLVVGALIPLVDLVVGPLVGGVYPLHSIVSAVGILTIVMLGTSGRRSVRKAALGIPIGLMVHLVASGIWGRTSVFWWPLAGFGGDGGPHPVIERGWWGLMLECVGAVLCVAIHRRARLADPVHRAEFRSTGRLDMAAGSGG